MSIFVGSKRKSLRLQSLPATTFSISAKRKRRHPSAAVAAAAAATAAIRSIAPPNDSTGRQQQQLQQPIDDKAAAMAAFQRWKRPTSASSTQLSIYSKEHLKTLQKALPEVFASTPVARRPCLGIEDSSLWVSQHEYHRRYTITNTLHIDNSKTYYNFVPIRIRITNAVDPELYLTMGPPHGAIGLELVVAFLRSGTVPCSPQRITTLRELLRVPSFILTSDFIYGTKGFWLFSLLLFLLHQLVKNDWDVAMGIPFPSAWAPGDPYRMFARWTASVDAKEIFPPELLALMLAYIDPERSVDDDDDVMLSPFTNKPKVSGEK